jgi:hypothetical protein
MTLPANIRLNLNLPFPALVQGSGPVTVDKRNGVFTLGFDIIDLGTGVPLPANFNNDYLIYYDAVLRTFLKVPFSSLPGPARPQRSIKTALDLPVTLNDSVLNVDTTAGPLTLLLPSYGLRNGAPLTFKDTAGTWAANNVTFTATIPDSIDGISNAALAGGALKGTVNRQSFTFLPMNDGVNTGYAII